MPPPAFAATTFPCLAFFTTLLVFTVNPSIPRESIDFLAGYEVPRPSSYNYPTPSLQILRACLFVHVPLFRLSLVNTS